MAAPDHSGVHKVAEMYPNEPFRSVDPETRIDHPEVRPELRPLPTSETVRTPPEPGIAGKPAPTDVASPELYLNRELTYLNFCWRVLHEAEDDRTPLLERVKFLAIVSANIDEFFQKRVGGLKQQVG